jgi:hypothetical protein
MWDFDPNTVVYLRTLSVIRTKKRGKVGWLTNNELEMMWKETAVALFEVITQNMLKARKTMEILSKECLRIWTQDV